MLTFIQDLLDAIEASNNSGGGGGETVTGSAESAQLDQFQPDAFSLAFAYGKHLIAGGCIDQEYNAGPPPLNKLAIGLGDAGPLGWEGPVTVWWAGEELSESPDDVTEGYHFHPGYWPEDDTDSTHSGAQEPDSFLADPLQFSGTAYTALLLTEAQSSENAVDKHAGIYECQKVYDYDRNGVQSATASYSVNPALVAADGFRRAGKLDRIHWPSWYAWKTFCDETISWDDGESVRSIPRFIACPVWLAPVSLPEFLDAVCLVSGAVPQDDGQLVRFRLVTDQTPVHHFDPDNTTGFQMEPDSLRQRYNRFKVSCRDLDDDYLKPVTLTIERPALLERYPVIEQSISLSNMTQSQLRRVGEMLMRVSTDNPNRASFIGGADAWRVLPGDYVTVSRPENGWNYQLCRVEAITDYSTSNRPDLRAFTVRRINGPIYYDTDHQKRQIPE